MAPREACSGRVGESDRWAAYAILDKGFFMDEIERARRAHSSIPELLKTSPIILRKPDTQILHTIAPEYTFTGIHENWDSQQIELALLMKSLSGKRLVLNNPFPDKAELDFKDRWFEGGDHELLKEIMKAGRIPLGWSESWLPSNPRTLQQALLIAKKRGYNVPEKFIETSGNVTYSESEAFYAAYMLVSGNFTSWREDSILGDRRDLLSIWNEQRSSVCQLTSQFIVPDPLDNNKTPYFLDQLWVYATSEQQVRLIGLEIDGEVHLDDESQKRSKTRDTMLAAMGYEIYHMAGWWCRIDPYRVVCEFLNASGIFPNAQNYILGHEYENIYDYKCQICHEYMVRWDIDSILETNIHDEYVLAHRECVEKASEGYFS